MRPAAVRARSVALGALCFFTLVACYAMLRPLRDEMAVRAGAAGLPGLFTGSLAAMLVATAAFRWLAQRVPRRSLFPRLCVLFAAVFAAFYPALSGGAPARLAQGAFFVWLNVFSLFAVSLSWSFLSEVFDRDAAPRIFGIAAAGASAGALAGPAATALLAPLVGPGPLLLFGAGLLLVCAACAARLLRRSGTRAPRTGRGESVGRPPAQPARASLLRHAALSLLGYTAISTFLYFSQTQILAASPGDAASRTTLFARMDVATNALALLLQLLVTGPLLRRAGAARAMAFVAALVTAGIVGVAVTPRLPWVLGLLVVHRAGHLAVGRPARELAFVSLDDGARYETKSFLDTALYRAGDAGSAWALAAAHSLGAGLAAMAWLALPVGIVWTVASWRLGRGVRATEALGEAA